MAETGEDEEGQGLVQAFAPEQPSVLGRAPLPIREAGCLLKGPQGLISASVMLTGKKYLFIVHLSRPGSSQGKMPIRSVLCSV